MKPIYMVHPRHGVHIAYSQAEVDQCKVHGWSLRDEPKSPQAASEPELIALAPKRRGRPKAS